MLIFNLYCDSYRYASREIMIDPLCVESVEQSERRPPDSGWQRVAIITMKSGAKHIVQDGGFAGQYSVASQIARALQDAQE